MPELPEVETIARGLRKRVLDNKIVAVQVLSKGTIFFEESLITEVVTEYKISSVRRRAKVLIWDLTSDYSLLFHLKMTGQIIYVPVDEERGTRKAEPAEIEGPKLSSSSEINHQKSIIRNQSSTSNRRFVGGHPTKSMRDKARLPDSTTRVIFKLDEGSAVFFNDQRKFGWLKLLPTKAVEKDSFLVTVGPEHDEDSFTMEYFWRKIRNRITPIKAVLLDQSVVAGIGNIYADESLHLAKIHPATKASQLSRQKSDVLYEAVINVLRRGIEKGGTSFTNYVNVEGMKGDYLDHARVFKREGLKCQVCGSEIIKTRVAGRGTHYCPTCQPDPKSFSQ